MQSNLFCGRSTKKILWAFMGLVLFLKPGFSLQTFAASETVEQNGVKITVSTDKDEYEIGESVNLNVSVDNENDFAVNPTVDQVVLPKGLKLNPITLPTKIEGNQSSTVNASASFDSSNAFEQWITMDIGSETLNVGIRALGDVFENGSTFYVQEILPGTSEWYEERNNLDNDFPVEHVKFMHLGVKKPNSEEKYTTLNGKATILVEVPKGWDIGELEAVFVSTGEDEDFEEFYEEISGKTYLKWHVTHFSPYAIIDKLTDADAKTEVSTSKMEGSTPKTGDNVILFIWLSVSVMALALLLIKKTRKNMVSLLLCVLLVGGSFMVKGVEEVKAYEKDLTVTLAIKVGGQDVNIGATFKCEWKAFDGEGKENLEILDNGDIKLKVFNDVLPSVKDIKIFDAYGETVDITRKSNADDGIVFSVNENLESEATYTLRLCGENGSIIDEFDFETEYDGAIVV